MCGLAGAILGVKRRRSDELRIISGIFTELLVLNEVRGRHAAGVAVIRKDGRYRLLKRPGPARQLVADKSYPRVLDLDNRVTVVLGHTRYKTRGSEQNSRNNHPIRAGSVIGTHNGHLANADHLAKKLRLRRTAEVDSEVLFRLASRAKDPNHFLRLLAGCRGRMSAAFVRLDEPHQAHLVKGDMPLSAAYVPRLRTVFYASEEQMLDQVLEGLSWETLELDPFTLSILDSRCLLDLTQRDMSFRCPAGDVFVDEQGKLPFNDRIPT